MRLPAAAVLAGLGLFAMGARAAAREHHHHEHHEHKEDPRKDLEKANALAGEGKCAEAVKYFTLAYDKLQDPIVLFNRGECYRRLGESAKAAEDYRGFLAGFPAAPNRKDIEARIAALEKAAAARAAAPTPPVAKAPAPPAAKPSPPPSPAAPPVARAPAPPPTAVPPPQEAMPFLPPPPGGETKTLVEAPRSTSTEAPKTEASHGSRWWLWTGLAVVLVGGGVGAYLYTRQKDQTPPMTNLGNYHF